jgi:serine/threonine protein kinase HipA of HipAB toxin-antitoxin module
MTEPQQPERDSSQGNAPQNELADELRELGDHIKNFLQALWESQERKRVQKEIEEGMTNLGASLNQAANEFQQSPTGHRIKEEFDSIGQRIQTGEMEASIRREFISALRTANIELEKALNKMSSADKPAEPSETEPKE